MKLSRKEFESLYAKNKLVLSFIGMSNAGKTFWSRRLERAGFKRVSCDDLIEESLGRRKKASGKKGIGGVAEWLGHPYEKGFSTRQKTYLDFERRHTEKTLAEIERGVSRNTVFDTTGSVIYAGSDVCRALQKHTFVVHLAVSKIARRALCEQFLACPKPLIWKKHFSPRPGEANESALKRCYQKLLASRAVLYKKYADCVVPHHRLRDRPSPKRLLDLVKSNLV